MTKKSLMMTLVKKIRIKARLISFSMIIQREDFINESKKASKYNNKNFKYWRMRVVFKCWVGNRLLILHSWRSWKYQGSFQKKWFLTNKIPQKRPEASIFTIIWLEIFEYILMINIIISWIDTILIIRTFMLIQYISHFW